MGEAMILRRGGSGLAINKPMIRVAAPTGSAVSISLNGETVRTLGPAKSIASTTADLSYYFFSVKDYGAYTITATRGTERSVNTLSVNDVREYDVRIWYDIILFANSTIHSEYTANNGYLSGGNLRAHIWMYFTPMIDVTKFSTLTFTVAGSAGSYHLFGLRKTKIESYPGYDGADAGYAVWQGGAGGISAGTYSLNISSLTGNYYVATTNYTNTVYSYLDLSYIRLY